MMTVAGGDNLSKIVEELVRLFGRDKVLTEPEDLYVYSFYGEFAIRHRETPVAVLRHLSKSDEKELNKIAKIEGIHVIGSQELARSDESVSPAFILDSREPINRATLTRRLSEIEKFRKDEMRTLRRASSLPQWFVHSIKLKEGYRIREHPDCDKGYCPIQIFSDSSETFSSKGRLLLTRGLLKGELAATKRLIDSMYTCTACGQCYDQLSPMGLEVNNAIIRCRYEIAKKGLEPSQCGTLSRNIFDEGNPMGMPAEDRGLWFEELTDEFKFEGNDVLYWAGCSTSYRLPSVIESTANVLKEAEVDFGLLGGDEGCCGLILYLMGLWDQCRENALKISERLQDSGVSLLVTSCAGCHHAFSRVYPLLRVQTHFKVLHTSQLMESLVLRDRLQLGRMKGSYMWHDPCDLGRHCGVFEPPRNVLKAIPGLELVEPPLNREHALCCGAGGGLWMYDTNLAEKLAQSKLEEEVSPLRVNGVVTGCPTCIMNLKYTAKSIQQEIDIFDLSEIVGKCL